jgi:hypothetical protein
MFTRKTKLETSAKTRPTRKVCRTMIHRRFSSQPRLHPSPNPESIAPFGTGRLPEKLDRGFRISFACISRLTFSPSRCCTKVERVLERNERITGW